MINNNTLLKLNKIGTGANIDLIESYCIDFKQANITSYNDMSNHKYKELVEILIRCFCPKNGTVLDAFSGSGIISITADELGNEYYASELDKQRYDAIKEKLNFRQASVFDFLEG